MYCRNCGKEVGDNRFCPACGTPVESASNQPNPSGTPYQQNQPYQQPTPYPVSQTTTPNRPPKKKLSKTAKIVIGVAAGIFIGIPLISGMIAGVVDIATGKTLEDSSIQSSESTTTIEPSSSAPVPQKISFTPEIETSITGSQISITSKQDSPDGTILQFMVFSNDLTESYTAEVPVQNGAATTTFEVTNTDPKTYGVLVMLQFNADTIVQPQATLDFYGTHGEKLSGDGVVSANFTDGASGNNAQKTFSVDYPSKEAMDKVRTDTFTTFNQSLIDSSNGIILDITIVSEDVYFMYVSNQWYLSSQQDKQYFAEEMLKGFKQIHKNLYGDRIMTLCIYDESGVEVAKSKMTGGMKIKK